MGTLKDIPKYKLADFWEFLESRNTLKGRNLILWAITHPYNLENEVDEFLKQHGYENQRIKSEHIFI